MPFGRSLRNPWTVLTSNSCFLLCESGMRSASWRRRNRQGRLLERTLEALNAVCGTDSFFSMPSSWSQVVVQRRVVQDCARLRVASVFLPFASTYASTSCTLIRDTCRFTISVCHLPLLLALALAKTITLTFSFDLPQFSSPYITMHYQVIKCTFPPKMSTGFTVAVFIF